MPIYETRDDLRREAEVAKILGDAWLCDMAKLPPMWPVDWACERNDKVVAFVEIKCRGQYSYEFIAERGGYLIDLRKIISFKNIKEASGIPCALCVRLNGDLYYWEYSDIKLDVRMRGRRDRPHGIEPCAMIPMELFKRVIHQSQNEASPGTSRPATSHSGSSQHPT